MNLYDIFLDECIQPTIEFTSLVIIFMLWMHIINACSNLFWCEIESKSYQNLFMLYNTHTCSSCHHLYSWNILLISKNVTQWTSSHLQQYKHHLIILFSQLSHTCTCNMSTLFMVVYIFPMCDNFQSMIHKYHMWSSNLIVNWIGIFKRQKYKSYFKCLAWI